MTKARDLGDNAQNTKPKVVDAKGDLIVGTGSDAANRLAAGSNGDTLVADSSQTAGLRYNPPVGSLGNPFVNGGMDIWQRGTSIAISGASGAYSADRWQGYRGSAGSNVTISRQATGDTTNLPNIQYAARIQRNNGDTATTAPYIAYSMETVNSLPFAGKNVTLSFYARRGANFSASSNNLNVMFSEGTGTDQNWLVGFTGNNNLVNTTVSLTTTWQRFVFTGTFANSMTQMGLGFYFVPTGTAGANDWFEVTGVQLDVGTWTASTAPTFRRAGGNIAGELSACQRYYYKHVEGATQSFGIGYYYSASEMAGYVQFPVTMRTTPTLSITSGTNYYGMSRNGGDDYVNSFTIVQASTTGSGFNNITEASGTAGQAGALRTHNASSFMAFSAEL